MAGDWIKVEIVTPDKPEVIGIADILGIPPTQAFGGLFMVWRWFDQHTAKGNAPYVTKVTVDRLSGVVGFADAMLGVGWLQVGADGSIALPHFDRHNGETAKQRGLTAKRVARSKGKSNAEGNATGNGNGNATGNGASVTNALPREEKRRSKPPLPPEHVPGLDAIAWNRWESYRVEIRKPIKPVSIPAAQRQLAGFGAKQASVVERSIANGWQGLFEPKPTGQPQAQYDPMRGAI